MIKAVLFDFDGTVINTNDLIIASYKYAFDKVMNREIQLDEILGLFGRPLLISLKEDYGEFGEALYYSFREFNESNHDNIAKPFGGVPESILAIKEAGYKIGIVTSKRREMLQRGLKLIGLENNFDVLIGAEDCDKHKPDPQPVLTACKKLGIEPKEAIYVGDSVFDILCGKNAGMKTCGVKYTLTEPQLLFDLGMDYFVDDIWELAKGVLNV